MKVTFTPALNNKLIQNKIDYFTHKKQEYKNIKELPKYSMLEMMGRTQTISFKGINTVEGNYVEHTCTEKTSSNGIVTEQILYNKQNGNYTHRITDKNGGLIRSEDYYPSQEKEIITTYDKDIVTIITNTPALRTVEKLDTENRRIYFEETIGDSVKTEETDYTRGRTKITQKIDGEVVEPIIVIDLATGESVTEGSLVIDTFYDEKTKEYTTKNIVTHMVHKKEKVDEKGKPVYSIEYNPKTGLILKDKRYGSEYTEDTFTGEEPNRLVSSLFVSSDGREKEVILYGEDGETIISHTIYLHRENGTLEQETKLNANQVILEKILYGKGESRTHHFYNEETTLKKSTKEYNKLGNLTTETIYYEDGNTPQLVREISKNGTFTVSHYNKDGIETKRNFYDENRNLLSSEFYNIKTNSLEKTIEYDLKTGEKVITMFDEEYETPINSTVIDKAGLVLSQTVFYEDGKTTHFKREYNKDRSYTDFAFNEKGKTIASKRFNADGTRKK